MSNPTMHLFSSVLDGQKFIGDINREAQGYRRAKSFWGGDLNASWTLYGEFEYLASWFYERLGCHYEEKSSGRATWHGMIWDMTLYHRGRARTRSLDTLDNYVSATYIDSADEIHTTAPAINAPSVGQFGRFEELISMDNYDATPAEARRDAFLARRGWPHVIPDAGALESGETRLDVVAAGYASTASNRFVSVANGSDDTLSNYLQAIITTDCEFLQIGSIKTNSFAVKRLMDIPQRAWDMIEELLALGDASQNLYQLTVDPGRYVRYEQLDTATPRYYIRGNGIYTAPGGDVSADLWAIEPGLVRDMDYAVSRSEPDALLADPCDMILEVVEVGADSGLSWRPLEYDTGEMLALQQEYAAWMAGSVDQGAEADPNAWLRTPWAQAGVKNKEWIKMSPAQRRAQRRAWKALTPAERRKKRKGG